MEKLNFNLNWTFYKKGHQESSQVIDLPHDAMIHEARDPESAGGAAVGWFPGGVYVYEKTFHVPEDWRDKTVAFEFEGVYRHSKVILNGKEAGGRPYGYTRFFVPADPYLTYGAENTIRVIADNSKMPNSRWYSGSGIYRPVHLWLGNRTHIEIDGVKVSTLSYAPAKILVETAANGGEIGVEILENGKVIAAGKGVVLELPIENARLWSVETPNLYQYRVTLYENEQVVDDAIGTFGIRKMEWSNKGLFINGQETKLRGGCIHHDNGILGAATYAEAEARRVRILKEAGFNAIRSSHNPASIALLEACDHLGMYVMDEFADMWYMHKNKYDYASDFDAWYKEDLRSMVQQDFNHPSVIMYSIGNEVSEPYQERGAQLTREMVSLLHSLDRNCAVTGGINLMLIYMASKGRGIYKDEGGVGSVTKQEKKNKQQASGSMFFNMLVSLIGPILNGIANTKGADLAANPCLDALDIAGYNYATARYPREGEKHPQRVVVGSETYTQDIAKNWELVKKYPYIIGDFMWTSWDYLGETSLGTWAYDGSPIMNKPYPWLLADSGAIDILGYPGAPAKYAAMVWGVDKKPYLGVRPVNHPGVHPVRGMWRGTNAIDSWSWKGCEGNKAEIEVYANAEAVELFLNGRSLGRKKLKAFKAAYTTKYAAGTLRAVAYGKDGSQLSESELLSATGKTHITLRPEETAIQAGGIAYVNIYLVGENSVVESNDDRKLTVTVTGGKLLGFGSANPCTEERFDSGSYTTFYGRALAVVQGSMNGELTIQVSGEGLEPAQAKISVMG